MGDNNDSLSQTLIDQLKLSSRTYGYLKRMQINTVADLMNYTQEDLLNLDPSCGEETIAALEQHFGLTLPENDVQ